MRFAFQTLIWGRRLGDVELVLDAIAACGYQGVEFAQSPDAICVRDDSQPEGVRPVHGIDELRRLVEGRGLSIVGLAGGSLQQRMDFCGSAFRPEYLYVEDWSEGDEEAMRAFTAQPPFTLGLHPHWLVRVQRASQVKDRLARYRKLYPNGQGLRFLPDTAHLTIAGDKPVEAICALVDSLAAVHLKDWTPCYGRYSHRYAQGFVPLGKGVVHPERVLKELQNQNYQGWIVVEQDFSDASPSVSASSSAEWLRRHGWMDAPPACCPTLQTVRVREGAMPQLPRTEEATGREMAFLEAALPATTRGPSRFYQTAVDALCELGGLEAVTLYSYFPQNDELYLLGVSGLWDRSCRAIRLARCGIFREVIREQRIAEFDLNDATQAQAFDDPDFVAGLTGKRLITVPIFNPYNPHQLRFLLNLFPRAQDFWGTKPAGRAELVRLTMHLSRLADFVADDVCSAAALQTSYECGHSKSKKEFVSNLVRLLQTQFHCEGVSVLLVNETGDRLELPTEATTGIEWAPSLKRHEHHYKRGEGTTGTVWATGEMRLLSEASRDPDAKQKSREVRQTLPRNEFLFSPMARLGGKVVGVIRLVNKRAPAGTRATTMFTDDDAAVLDSIIQAALPYLELLVLQERQTSAIARMTHEFQVPMVAIAGAVDLMQHGLAQKGLSAKELFGEDYFGDVLNWARLMGLLANNARVFATEPSELPLRVSRTFLKRDVVAPAVHQVGSLLREYQFTRESISFSDFADVAPLWIDRLRFQQVFFNLLSNSIKYADKGRLKVHIDAGQHGNAYLIWFQDWGPGIEKGLEELIFQPGYRSLDAMRRDVAGQGIGLHIVRTIVEAHGGRIRLASHSQPTVFEISLPLSLRQNPPAAAKPKEI